MIVTPYFGYMGYLSDSQSLPQITLDFYFSKTREHKLSAEFTNSFREKRLSERSLNKGRIILIVTFNGNRLLSTPNIIEVDINTPNERLVDMIQTVVNMKELTSPLDNSRLVVADYLKHNNYRIYIDNDDNTRRTDLKKMKSLWSTKLASPMNTHNPTKRECRIKYDFVFEDDVSLKIKG